jgi:hypothetical protein
MDMPAGVGQDVAPCVLHACHAPITVNEYHDPFPQAWQRRRYGAVVDDTTVAVCATGHNTIHAALSVWEQTGRLPRYATSSTRALCERAIAALDRSHISPRSGR